MSDDEAVGVGAMETEVEGFTPVVFQPVPAAGIDEHGRLVTIRVDDSGYVIPSPELSQEQVSADRAEAAEGVIEAFKDCRDMLLTGSFPFKKTCKCKKCEALRALDRFVKTFDNDENDSE